MIYLLYTLLALLGVVVLLLLAALIRTFFLKPQKPGKPLPADSERSRSYGEKLGAMINAETVSVAGETDKTKFLEFHKKLAELYPNIHRVCEKTELRGNLLFKWKGKSDKKPILIMSHTDTVAASADGWEHPPFSGEIVEHNGKQVVWGRGTVDTKGSLMCFLQAAEELIADGYTPECDVYLASSCTEELGGEGGPLIASYLKEHGVELYMLLDEGGMMMEEPIKGAKGVFAMIGVLEKGYGDLKFTAKSNGGHASAPPKNTPIARLAAFVNEIEKHSPFKAKFQKPVRAMFAAVAPSLPFGLKYVLGNLWLFGPLILKLMPKINSTCDAMLHTTMAFTMQEGSSGYNVIPQNAYVTANMRFIQHQATDESIKLVTDIAKKHDIETEVIYRGYPPAIVDTDGAPYKLVADTVKQLFPDVTPAPYAMTGGTDARFYDEVCKNCIRFAPLKIDAQQFSSIHGLNENIDIETLPGGVDFYKAIIKAQKSAE